MGKELLVTDLLVRNVDPELHSRLKASAAAHKRPLGEELRELLRLAVARQPSPSQHKSLVTLIDEILGPDGGFDIELPTRHDPLARPPINFNGPEYNE
jgi:plasmid stability protein